LKNIKSLKSQINFNWIDDAMKDLKEELYFKIIEIIFSLENFSLLIQDIFFTSLEDCLECQEECLSNPTEQYPTFEESCIQMDFTDDPTIEIKDIIESNIIFKETHIPLLQSFEITLRTQNLNENTIDDKIGDSLELTEYLFFELAIAACDIGKKLNEKMLTDFLSSYAIENEIIQSKTAMNRMKRSIKSFLDFLSNTLSVMPSNKKENLKKSIQNIEIM
jgi:hypothetical protein